MKSLLNKWIKKMKVPFAVLIGSASLTLVLLNWDFYFLEANLYDLRMSLGQQSQPDPNIVLIAIDDKTMKELNPPSPLDVDYHTQLLETLADLAPRAIGYLVDMNQIQQINSRFIQSIEKVRSHEIPFLLGTPFEVSSEILPPSPLDRLPHAVAVVHKDGNVFSDDQITRRALLSWNGRPSFHLQLARQLGFIGSQEFPRGAFFVPEMNGYYFFFRYHGEPNIAVDHPDTAVYPTYSLIDVIRHRIAPEKLQNRIILVGTALSKKISDFSFTPYSKEILSNPNLVIHANILDSLIEHNSIVRAPGWLNWLVTFIVITSVLWWIIVSPPFYGVIATVTMTLIFIGVNQILFQFQGIWLRESQPLMGIAIGFYLAVSYRLMREHKKRWEYQEKNILFTQVEELKTNFLNLVTHDLKTPVARIQGLSEMILRNSRQELSQQTMDSIKNILSSTEDLNRFISSILELNQVESNRLHLHFESKDINRLIEQAVENFRSQAQNKNISLKTHLEPLFSIQVDTTLISKVLNNLIDNAIKYSHSDSYILIESKEEGNWVVISIQDQGIGMTPEEANQLFTRFYRAKNLSTSEIPGNGLGLYLTRYFIEAHRGRVEVKSEPGKGSLFRIFLPITENTAQLSESNKF